MTDKVVEIDVTKMTNPAAIKVLMKLLGCTEQQAQEFIALAKKRVAGDVIDGGNDGKEESRASRSKEAGGDEEADDLREDG